MNANGKQVTVEVTSYGVEYLTAQAETRSEAYRIAAELRSQRCIFVKVTQDAAAFRITGNR